MLAFSGMRFGSGLRFRSSELFLGVNGFRLRIAISRGLPWAFFVPDDRPFPCVVIGL